jgi:hypothetical protein
MCEVLGNNTLDHAQDLGSVPLGGDAAVIGNVGDSPEGAAEVDWYQFTLAAPAQVLLTTQTSEGGSTLKSVLSLYNDDKFDFGDPVTPLHHRLLAQDDTATHSGDAFIDQLLGAGTYYVAVSGSGNRYFHPLLADSGFFGSTGTYALIVATTDPGIASTDGPAVLSVDPAQGSVLDRSPFAIRVDLSSALDPSTINNAAPGQTVSLTFNPNGTFGDSNDMDIPLTTNFSSGYTDSLGNFHPVNELQLFPQAPLAVGYYKLTLVGDSTNPSGSFLADLSQTPLGKTNTNSAGANYSTTFQVNGVTGLLGSAVPADTIDTAHQLNDITTAGIVEVPGAIGVDPTDPSMSYNGGAVEIYHFQISGPGQYAFTAEAFAGRIGSPLDPALTLFQKDANGLHLLGMNDNTNNTSVTSDNSGRPLFNDAALFKGLTAGDYYIVVSSSPNLPDPTQPWQAGPQANGSFDPTTSHSSNVNTLFNISGRSPNTGPYVLTMHVDGPDNVAPTVKSITPSNGSLLNAPPTQLTVQFSEPVNLIPLANDAFLEHNQSSISSVYVLGPDGTKYFPRLISFDDATNTATFMMLNGLANGVYQIHLSGANGLTDFAGNPVQGNSPSGDYVAYFMVSGPVRGINGDPLHWADQEPNDSLTQPQNLGVLFPKELAHVTVLPDGSTQNGVTVTRDFSQNPLAAPQDTADFYQFQVLQDQTYIFTLNGSNLSGLQLQVWDSSGNLLPAAGQDTAIAIQRVLSPGTYIVGVSSWQATNAAGVVYNLNISIGGDSDNPPPLTNAPGPAIRLRIAADAAVPPLPAPASTGGSPSQNPPAANPPAPNPPPAAPTASTPQSDGSVSPATPAGTNPPVTPPQVTITVNPGGPAPGNPPVGSSTADNGAVNSASGFSSFPNIPSNLLVALGSGPAGGVQSISINTISFQPDRVVVEGQNPFLIEGIIRITTLTQGNHLPGNDSTLGEGNPARSPGMNWPSVAAGSALDIIKPFIKAWQQSLDSVFGAGNWMQWLPLAAPQSMDTADIGQGEEDSETHSGLSKMELLNDAAQAWTGGSRAADTESGWANLLSALGAFSLATGQSSRRNRGQRLGVRGQPAIDQ